MITIIESNIEDFPIIIKYGKTNICLTMKESMKLSNELFSCIMKIMSRKVVITENATPVRINNIKEGMPS